MSSGVSGAAQHGFLSTHNALRIGDGDEDRVWIDLVELAGSRREAALHVYAFYDIEMVKRLAIKKLELPPSINVNEIRIFYRGSELPNHRSLVAFIPSDRGVDRIKFHWALKEGHVSCGVRELGIRSPPHLRVLLSEINLALQRGYNPRLTLDGTGGTYLLVDSSGQTVALFKPKDEEAFAPNNPRGYEGKLGQRGFRSGVFSGEGAEREVIAFLLDAQYGGIAGVPQTTKAEACHPSLCYKKSPQERLHWKEGSLQEFIDAREAAGDFDASVFSVHDAHKIGWYAILAIIVFAAIFDLRVLNLDRNDGNILVGPALCQKGPESLTLDGKASKYRLVPIDHGLILPDTMNLGDIDLVWFDWAQSKHPFSEEEVRHILTLDPDRDAQRLARKLDIREECLRTMRVSTRVLQIGTRMKLHLHQIASLMVRFDDFSPSIMERGVSIALNQACTLMNAVSLVQQTRLARNSLHIDLHLAEPMKGRGVRFTSGAEVNEESESANDEAGTTTNSNRPLSLPSSVPEHGSTTILETLLAAPASFPLKLPPGLESIQSTQPSFAFNRKRRISEGGVSLDSEEEGRITGGIPTLVKVSRISGVPLPNVHSSTLPSLMPDTSSLEGSDISSSSEDHKTRRSEPAALLDARQRKRRTGFSRRDTRGTHLKVAEAQSSWAVYDRNKQLIRLDWDDPLLEKTFFHCFELLIWHYILETHRDWQSYAFNGEAVLAELRGQRSTRKSKKLSDRFSTGPFDSRK